MPRLFFLVRPPPRFVAVRTTRETRTEDPFPGVNDDDGIRDFNRFRNLCGGRDRLRRRVVLAVGIL